MHTLGSDSHPTFPTDDLSNSRIDACSPDKYVSHWLKLQGEFIESVQTGTVLVKSSRGDESERQWYWPADHPPAPNHFTTILDRAASEWKGVVISPPNTAEENTTKQNRIHISYPVTLKNNCVTIAAFEIQPTGEPQLQRAMKQLQWGMLWLQNFFLFQKEDLTDNNGDTENSDRFKQVFDLLDGTLNTNHCADAAAFLTTELATILRCDRVTVGLLDRHKIKILALSHSAENRQKTNIINAIIAALEESVDQRETILFPPPDTTPGIIYRAHSELADKFRCGSLLTIPFLDDQEKAYGAILFERSADEPFNEPSVTLCEAVASLSGPVLRDKHSHDLPLVRKSVDRTKQYLGKIFGRTNLGTKMWAVLLLLGLLFLGFAKGDFQISAEATLSGEIQQAVIAPFPGYVNTAEFSAGDHVEKDAILASLDTGDLTLEQLQWASRKRQADLEYQRAIAGNLTADSKIIMEQRKQAEIQLSLLDMKIKRMTLTAPFGGLLVKGDLSQTIGAPVEQGQVLFEIVPDDAFRIILDVDERDINFIAVGQTGTLVLNALPHQHIAFAVEKITPVSTPVNGRNTFRVEGKMHKIAARFRPGMRGYGKILIARVPLIWIWSRPILDRIKLWFWSSVW